MRALVVVPYFEAEPERAQALRLVFRHLARLGQPVIYVGGSSPAEARNAGARSVVSDVLVFNDADTIVDLEQIRVAASLAADQPGLVFAFDQYRRLSRQASERLAHPDDCWASVTEETLDAPPSHGCVAISRRCFEEVGGYDERLEVYEDCALSARCGERWPSRRVEGPACHLWHPRPYGDVEDPAFRERYAGSRRVWLAEYPEAWPAAERVG